VKNLLRESTSLGVLIIALACGGALAGPYAPAVGQSGSTALHMDDPNFLAWADGWQDYLVGDLCDLTWQTPANALGPAQGWDANQSDPDPNRIVTLGRGGTITLTFSTGIGDRPGWDLAVFENAISDTFLELAWVEVSSDGVHFFRFPNDSLTPRPSGDDPNEWPAFTLQVDATNITGLAGKYRHSYGTPFDLAELRGVSPLLDVNNVRHVRLVDVVGDGTCLDTSGDAIYDPYPTSGSAGFDLDAVGVLHLRTADFNLDGQVNSVDLLLLSEAWLSSSHAAQWNERCDIDGEYDGVIDHRDYAVFQRQWAP
jgi:hypothetical protein